MQRTRGFTLIELVVVLVVIGVLAVFAIPRFSGRATYDTQGFTDQAGAAIRYAQKSAIAQRRTVAVCIDGSAGTLALAIGSCAGSPLNIPGRNTKLTAPSGVSVSTASFSFDALGRPNAGIAITVSGDPPDGSLTVEQETGYVH